VDCILRDEIVEVVIPGIIQVDAINLTIFDMISGDLVGIRQPYLNGSNISDIRNSIINNPNKGGDIDPNAIAGTINRVVAD
jgi:hypothetical protein